MERRGFFNCIAGNVCMSVVFPRTLYCIISLLSVERILIESFRKKHKIPIRKCSKLFHQLYYTIIKYNRISITVFMVYFYVEQWRSNDKVWLLTKQLKFCNSDIPRNSTFKLGKCNQSRLCMSYKNKIMLRTHFCTVRI